MFSLSSQTLSKLQVIVLAFAAFVFNTTEFIPIALLSDIGASFGKSASEAGIMMTVYAWVVAIFSLPAMLLSAKVERKRLLLGLFLVFVLAHGISAIATSFSILLFSRIIIALAHAIFWSITASLVVRLAPMGWQTQALGVLATGSALALVAGLPLGRLLGQYLSWQATFAVIGGAGCLVLVALVWLLPTLVAKNTGSLSSIPHVFNNKALLMTYALTVLLVTAHFTAYSYIEPFVLLIGRFDASFATLILLIFGIAGLIASWLFGRFYDVLLSRFLYIAMSVLVMSLLLIYPLVGVLGQGFIALALFWGVAITAVSLVLQIQVLKLAPQHSDVAMSIFSGLYNVGIGGGALVGAIVTVKFGLATIGFFGALFVIVAFVGILGARFNRFVQ